MSTFQDVATELDRSLVTKKRETGERFISLVDARPGWAFDAVYEAHDDRLPNDETCSAIAEAVALFADCDDEDDATERMHEIEADVYTSDQTAWLASHADNLAYLDRAAEELDISGSEAIGVAQYLWKQEIAQSVLSSIIAEVEARAEVAV